MDIAELSECKRRSAQLLRNIPQALRELPWGVASLRPILEFDGSPRLKDNGLPVVDKAPRHPMTGKALKVDDPTTWATYEEAVAAVNDPSSRYQAAGLLLTRLDPFLVIDIDAPNNPLSKRSADSIWYGTDFTYREISQSGRGAHIFLLGELPNHRGRRGHPVEIYDDRRFIIVTGNIPEGGANVVAEDRFGLIPHLLASMPSAYCDDDIQDSEPARRSDSEVLDRMLRDGRRADEIRTLFYWPPTGDWSADLQALCNHITYYTPDHAQAMRLVRQAACYNFERKAAKSGYKTPEKYDLYVWNRAMRPAYASRARMKSEWLLSQQKNTEQARMNVSAFLKSRGVI